MKSQAAANLTPQSPATRLSTAPLLLPRLAVLLCFALLGALAAGRRQETVTVAMSACAGFAVGGLFMLLFGWLLGLSFAGTGRQAVGAAVTRGFLLLIPFTILAVAAESVLHWQAAGALASAGIMTASAAIGPELVRLGGRRAAAILLPTLGGTLLAGVWITAITWLVRIGGG